MFSSRLKELRQKAKVTQKELAVSINSSQQNIALYEQGKRKPKYETLEKLAVFFNVSTDYLLGKTDILDSDPDIDLDTAINHSVAFDGTPITDDDREAIKNYLKDYFANKK
ncbi:helix-turn-helix domain-containing protein [Streptococcus gordonii]|jgi:HTH-type transcriptional regulator xre|uniref:helix-turn-helix domain-containing protein n=1 Tax=Streptococcus gordonii TaxID=1302 RepID=UPI00073C9670|nr:helix-turn-helix transcriptional regulator [Streptococcus gordonii]KTF20943.1 transcriptional regulator [Streptococcus gordonii]KXC03292.1 transcriptional regulator [Streptococcus gordonii]MBZ2149841.1 helix-turn-helix domain-containing protein [Streptococcus gordonii]QWZ58559.1 helix-turn-helix domain-containing protein [Streptococcus gordonii]SQF28647.1 ICESt1 APR2 Cro/CI family transcriptional regulator [Streptococcus gordonii]